MSWSEKDAERLEREGLELVRRYAERNAAPLPPTFSGVLSWPRLSYALNVLLLLLIITGYVARDRLFPVIPSVHVHGTSVTVSQPGGEPIWSHDFDVPIEKAALAPWDRRPRRLIVATKLGGRGDATLSNWDFREDRVLWTHTVPREELLPFYPEHNAEPGTQMRCNTFAFADLEGDGTAELVAAFRHETYFPSCVRTLDPEGEIVGTYFNWGYIDDVVGADIDGDGRDEILASGTNNAPEYQGATVILLDADHLSGYSVDAVVDRGSEYRDGSLVRLVVPAWDPELMRHLRFERLHASDVRWRPIDRTIDFKVGLRTRERHVYVTVRVDSALHPIKVIPHGWVLTESRRALESGEIGVDATAPRFWEDWLAGSRRFGALATGPA